MNSVNAKNSDKMENTKNYLLSDISREGKFTVTDLDDLGSHLIQDSPSSGTSDGCNGPDDSGIFSASEDSPGLVQPIKRCRAGHQSRPVTARSGQLSGSSRRQLFHFQDDSLLMPSPGNISDNSSPEHKRNSFHEDQTTENISPAKLGLDRAERNDALVGDFSRACCLPLVAGKNSDLQSISANILADVIRGKYSEVIDKVLVIDCRYPYEYDGGHIQHALNIYSKDVLVNMFFGDQRSGALGNKTVLIFHCEFSSERGPRMARFLRGQDRNANKDNYPHLFYPEIYLLEGGYKTFFLQHNDLCTPEGYLPMKHKDYSNDLRHFRVKSRSWGARDRKRPAKTTRPKSLQFLA